MRYMGGVVGCLFNDKNTYFNDPILDIFRELRYLRETFKHNRRLKLYGENYHKVIINKYNNRKRL